MASGPKITQNAWPVNSLELAAIGSCLDPDTSSLAVFEAPSELFLSDEGKVLHQGVMALYRGGYAITPQSLEVYLYTEKGIDQSVANGWVVEALAQRSSKEDIPYLVNALRQVAINTMTKELGEQLSSGSVKRIDDVLGRISEFTQRVSNIGNSRPHTYEGAMMELLEQGPVKYFTPRIKMTASAELSPLEGKWQLDEGDVCYLAGRSAAGKTAMMLNFLLNNAMAGHMVGLVEIEMRERPLASRLSSMLSGINSRSISTGSMSPLEREHMRYAMEKNKEAIGRIRGIEPSSFRAELIKPTLERWRDDWGCEMVGIDYVQIVEAKGSTATDQVKAASRAITEAAKSTGIAIIALSQARRTLDKGDVGMSDFRDSSQLENDASTMVVLNAADGYEQGSRVKPVWCELVKSRNGFLTKDLLHYDLPTQVFSHSGEYAKATKQPEAPKQPF